MPMEPELRAMLTQTITQMPYTGTDAYGKPTYGGAVQRAARVQYRTQAVLTPQGVERRSTTVVICDGEPPVSLRDQIVLPDGSAPAIQQVYSAEDPDHPGVTHHFELRL